LLGAAVPAIICTVRWSGRDDRNIVVALTRGLRSVALGTALMTVLVIVVLASELIVPVTISSAAAGPAGRVTNVDCMQRSHADQGQPLPDGFPIGSSGIPVQVHIGVPVLVRINCSKVADASWLFRDKGTTLTTALATYTTQGTTVRADFKADARGYQTIAVVPSKGDLWGSGGKHGIANELILRFNIIPYKIYAIGDSWTAGFGYYSDGSAMPTLALPLCRPGSGKLNDRCSSNGRWNGVDGQTAGLSFADDYGLKNNISWAAQVANTLLPKVHGGTYVNYAVSGGEPKDFLPGGSLYKLTQQTVAADPDITLVTLGGNPILGEALFGLQECEYARKEGLDALHRCATNLFREKYHVVERLSQFYQELLKAPDNHVVVSNYMFTAVYFPFNNYTFGELSTFMQAITDAVSASVESAKQADPSAAGRLYLAPVVSVPTGQRAAQSGPGTVECKRGSNATFTAKGSSVLATIVQEALGDGQFRNTFCGVGAEYKVGSDWKKAGTDPWFNSPDLGTHPTRLGYKQLADMTLSTIREHHIIP
jgi:lysophospholipase L1-like esterase